MERMKTDMELLSNSMATYAHIKGNYGNPSNPEVTAALWTTLGSCTCLPSVSQDVAAASNPIKTHTRLLTHSFT